LETSRKLLFLIALSLFFINMEGKGEEKWNNFLSL
jgi:hypothetical protein